MNQVVLVGRLTSDPQVSNTENGKPKSSIVLAVTRSFKNIDGIYETDFIRCVLWNGIASNTAEFCHKGDIVGIKGRLQTYVIEEEKEKKYFTEVIAEKVSFLSSKKSEAD